MKRLTILFLLIGVTARGLAAERPNILLIVSEDNGPELGCYGEPSVQTPHLDALAKGGILFERAYVPQAGCSQSRAALLTGLFPHQNGQIGLATWKFRLYDANIPNLPRRLKAAGYRTCIIGKLHINPEDAFPFDFKAIPSSNFSRKKLGEYATEAARFINASEVPFFLSVNYPDAHRPFIPQVNGRPEHPLTAHDVQPLSYFGLDTPQVRQQTADYYNCMSRLDTQVGGLLKILRESGKEDNTLIVYMGDHGADLLRGKRTSYEGGVRVPLIASWTGRIEPGQLRRELISTLDLMPTFLKIAGAKPVAGLPGRELSELFEGAKPEWRRYLFTEYHTHSAHNYFPQRTVRDDRYKLIHNLMHGVVNPGYEFTRRKFFEQMRKVVAAAPEPVRSAYKRMERPPEYELYDLQADPFEFQNLSEGEQHAAAYSRLKRELVAWRQETEDPMLDPKNVFRLKQEIDACLDGDDASKAKLKLSYPDYFFSSSKSAQEKASVPCAGASQGRPNVLFLCVDDMKDWVNCLGGYEGTVHTPNIDRLAARGTLFTNAHCASPKCAPSRAALMTGLRPSTTGLYGNSHWWYPNLPGVTTIPVHFKDHGYLTAAAGKIFHHTAGNHPPNQWDDFRRLTFKDDPWFRGVKLNYPWSEHTLPPPKFPFCGFPGLGHENDWGPLGYHEQDYDDSRTAQFAVDFLASPQVGPFFLACGLFRPHLPWYVPEKYFRQYPLDEIVLPATKANDLDDIPMAGQAFAKARRGDFETIVSADAYKRAVRAYLASITYADTQLGRVLDALDSSVHRDETVIVLWSDHGWHLGEKGHWHKSTLWEEATRVPFIIAAPGIAPNATSQPVSLIDVYPTLNDLCGLPANPNHDGLSLAPLMRNPHRDWNRPAIIEYEQGNVAVRSLNHRYIRYRDGSEELYDFESDPYEWENLAAAPRHAAILAKLKDWTNYDWAAPAPTKAAFKFDPNTFTWTDKKSGQLFDGTR